MSNQVDQDGTISDEANRKRGRPKGSKNKSLDNEHLSEGTPSRPKKSHGADLANQIEQDETISDDGHVSQKRGRPKGSKNKRPRKSLGADSSNQFEQDGTVSDGEHVKRKRGRPKGSKNKSVIIYDQ